MLETVLVVVLAVNYLLDKHIERQVKKAEIEKMQLENKKLALEIKKASKK